MECQIFSDIHLEFMSSIPKIEKKADILFLLGDIGFIKNKIFEEFINYVNKTWEKIFIILGNHEYYSSKYHFSKLKNMYKEYFKDYKNIIFLDKNIFENEKYIIFGATFWSYCYSGSELIINNFKQIKYYDEIKKRKFKITLEFNNKKSFEEKNWLLESLDKIEKCEKTLIILSHYPLHNEETFNPKYKNQDEKVKNCFVNNYHNEILKYKNKFKKILILSGHTHYNYDFIKNNIRYISNQFGYKGEIKKNMVKMDKFIL